jgi:hypothetical protein
MSLGPARPALGPAHQARLENRVGPSKPMGLFSYPSLARSGPKRDGPTHLEWKKQTEKRLSGPVSTF